jgi:hypothetical protein
MKYLNIRRCTGKRVDERGSVFGSDRFRKV